MDNRKQKYSNYSHVRSKYLGKVMDDWRKERISKIDDLLIIELQGLNRVEREAWDGWYRSLKDKTKNVSKRKGSPQKRKYIS